MDAAGKAFDLIVLWEGWRASSYKDVAGIWTVGYGATGPGIGPNTVWEEDRAQTALKTRIAHDQHIIEALTLDRPLNSNQAAACTSLAYNIGLSGFEHSSVRKHWLAHEDKAAADSFLLWDKSHVNGQLVVVPGLEHRRVAERELFLRAP